MYCPQCSTENAQTFKYCTRCGTNLDAVLRVLETPQSNPSKAGSLMGSEHVKYILAAIIILGLGGIIGTSALVYNLAAEGIREPTLPLIGVFGYGAVVAIVTILARLLFRGSAGSERKPQPARPDRTAGTSAAYLPPPSISSVVEQNTSRMPSEERRTKG